MNEIYLKHFLKEVQDYRKLGLSERTIKIRIRTRLKNFSHLRNTKTWTEFYKFVFEKTEFTVKEIL